MSYQAMGWFGFADSTQHPYEDVGDGRAYDNFKQASWSVGEVYVYRFIAYLPAALKSFSQVYPYVRAYVQSMPLGNRNQDILGIAAQPSGSGGETTIEIVFKDAGGYHTNADRAGETLTKMKSALASAGKSLDACCPAYLQLKEAVAVQKWLGRAPLWSYARFNAAGGSDINTGYTKAMEDGSGYWVGSAQDPRREVAPQPPTPIIPPPPDIEPDGGSEVSPERGGGGLKRRAPGIDLIEDYEEPTNYGPLIAIGAVAAVGIGLVWLTRDKARA